MPRARLVREPCECLDCREPPGAASGAAAIARQDPPPKSLILCLTEALLHPRAIEEADVPHLDALVHSGWAGLLACRAEGPALPLQLLGLQQAGVPPPQSLPSRWEKCIPIPLWSAGQFITLLQHLCQHLCQHFVPDSTHCP